MAAPDLLRQIFRQMHVVGRICKGAKQAKLGRCEVNRLTADRDAATSPVDTQGPDDLLAVVGRLRHRSERWTPQGGLDTGFKLVGGKRLANEVVCAELEAEHGIFRSLRRRADDDRDGPPLSQS